MDGSSDAPAELDRRRSVQLVSDQEAALIADWMANGYVILKGAVSPDDCDALADEIASAWRDGAPDLLTQSPQEREAVPPAPGTAADRMRIVDVDAARPTALKVLMAPSIVRF